MAKLGLQGDGRFRQGLSRESMGVWISIFAQNNPFPLIINDVPPPRLIINNPGGQNLFIIRGEYLLRGFGRAAFKFLLKSIEIKIKSKLIN